VLKVELWFSALRSNTFSKVNQTSLKIYNYD
jgi:hypothetical protein